MKHLIVLFVAFYASFAFGGTFRTEKITAPDGTSVQFPAGLTIGEDTKAPVSMVDTVAKLTDAIASVANNETIYIKPGTYTLTTKLTITKPMRLVCMAPSGDNGCKITSGASLTTELVFIQLAAQSASAEVYFKDIYFLAAGTNTAGVIANNTNVAQKLKIRFADCIIELADMTASTAYGLQILHASTSKEIQVYVTGQGWHRITNINFVTGKDTDSLKLHRMRIAKTSGVASGIIVGTGAYTFMLALEYCEIPLADATSGGHASNSNRSIFSWTDNGAGTVAAAVAGDLDSSGTETIVGT
jgi:hypothetical protein